MLCGKYKLSTSGTLAGAGELVNAPDHSSARKANNSNTKNLKLTENTPLQVVGIFPNPNYGTFTVNVVNSESSIIEILNITGQVVYQQVFKNNKVIDTNNHLAKGMYLCKVLQGGKVIYQNKLVIQ